MDSDSATSGGAGATGGTTDGAGATSSVTGSTSSGASGGASGTTDDPASSSGGASGTIDTTGAAGTTGSTDPYAPEFPGDLCRPNGPPLEEVEGARLIYNVDGLSGLQAIALSGDALFISEQGEGLYRVQPATGSEIETVVVDDWGWGMVATDDYLFYTRTNFREFWRAPLDTLPATPEFVMEDVSETHMFSDGTDLYFSRSSTSETLTIPLADLAPGAEPRVLIEDNAREAIALGNDGYLYYIDRQTVGRVSLEGGLPDPMFSISNPRDIAIDEGVLYLINDVIINSQPIDTIIESGLDLTRLAIANLRSETSEFEQDLSDMRISGDRIYYREENGALAWVSKDGSDCRIVAEVSTRTDRDLQWEMTDSHYYVIKDNVQVWEIPR